MNHIMAVAFGGACGAVLRYLMSTGLYQWLGRDFPYGTLAVNIVGSLMMGLLTEALLLQKIAMTTEYRSALLIGFIGAFTTFSTFSLDTVYLLEQGQLTKAGLNIIISVLACLGAVWLGLACGRALFMQNNGLLFWFGGGFPYAIIIVNLLCALVLGVIATLIFNKVSLASEYQAAIVIIMIGLYLTLSGLYAVLFLIEHDYLITANLSSLFTAFFINGLACLFAVWLGMIIGHIS